jgi:hypothetical protein
VSVAGPVIARAELGAGHDGQAEVAIELVYANGGRSRLSVPHAAVAVALDRAGVEHLEDLAGRPWTVLLDAIALS